MGLSPLRTLLGVKGGSSESVPQTPQLRLGTLTPACSLCPITLVDVLLNWLSWFHFLFLGSLLNILIDCMIFLSPFLDVTRMPISTNSFLAQLDSIVCFLLTYNLNVFKSRINRHLLTGSF